MNGQHEVMPAFITASGPMRHKLFADIKHHFLGLTPFVKPAEQTSREIEIFTYNNRPKPSYLETQCARLGIKVTVTASDYRPWNWFGKVGPLIHAMRRSTAQYVFCLDGDDTCPIRRPELSECVELRDGIRFVRGNDWPDVPWLAKNTEHMYPAAGAYFGKRETVLRFLVLTDQLWKARNPVVIYRHGFDDQLAWKFHHSCHSDLLSIDEQGQTVVNLAFDPQIISRIGKLTG